MKVRVSSQVKRNRLLLIVAFALISSAFSLGVAWNPAGAQSKLTLADVLTGLKSTKVTLTQRNTLLTNAVWKRGVTFALTAEIEKELRATGANNTLIDAIRENGPAVITTVTPRTNVKASALFQNLWVDYGVTEGGQLGMRIHVKFTAYKMKNLDSYLAIYFLDKDGTTLKDNNGKFNSSSGDVAVYKELIPEYDPKDYGDLAVFMPYSELDLSDGNWDLKMDVKLIYKAGGLIQDLTKEAFNYKKGDSVNKKSDSVTAKVNRVWVDYDITDEGRRGMRIHVSFEVNGLKGVDSLIVARVQKTNGDYLLNNRSDFSNDSGQLQTSFTMKPGFDPAVYKDADLFLPYDEIKIAKGVWNLKLDIDISYADGELIQHLDFHDFKFTQP
ncbi:MAG: hypothetical protein ABJA66_01510 [Actinomycetota bacterium]